jgi:hypothetical protein
LCQTVQEQYNGHVLSKADVKEQLSLAHVIAVASSLGYSTELIRVDRDSIDVEVRARGLICPGAVVHSPQLALQLKATCTCAPKDGEFPFKLPQKNYEDLRPVRRAVPALLVVYVMPRSESRWVAHSDSELVTRRCAFWSNLKGRHPSSNSTSTTVRIATDNVFSPAALAAMMERLARDEEIGTCI